MNASPPVLSGRDAWLATKTAGARGRDATTPRQLAML